MQPHLKYLSIFVGLFAIAIANDKLITVPLEKKMGKTAGSKYQKILSEFHSERAKNGIQMDQFIHPLELDSEFLKLGKTKENTAIDIDNLINLHYTGPLKFGTPLQGNDQAKFFYDTSTGTTITTSKKCGSGCVSQYYDSSKSTTSQAVGNRTSIYNMQVENVTGTYIKDRVCISENLCVNDWTFFEIEKTQKFLEVDGILGFSPINKTSVHDTSFVKALYDAGEIPDMVATFQL